MNREEYVEQLREEIAKLSERIAELHNDASYYASRNEELRAELAAIKAQEPVWSASAEIAAFESFDYADRCFRLRREGQRYVYATTEKELELFRAGAKWGASLRPVSEAKTQGVDGLEVFQFDWDTCNSISNGWPDDVFPLIESLPYDPLCRLADAKAIIDGLRGKVGSQRVKTCIALKERNDALKERDQQAQRIAALEVLLGDVLSTHDYHTDDGAEAAERAYEVLYSGKESK